MKSLAKEVAAGLAFAAIGVAVSLAVVVVHGVEASPEPRVSWVYRGVTPFHGWQCAAWNQFPGWDECWHSNEVGQYTAIDYNRGEQTAGSGIWVDYDGDFELFKMLEYTGNCKGVRAAIYWDSYDPANYMGDIHYLHIDVNAWVINEELTSQVLYIGDVTEEDKPDCPGWVEIEGVPYWPPHLHQSADCSASTPFYSNKFVDPSQGDNWQHAIVWNGSGDSDGDGFTDWVEAYLATDAYDDCPNVVGSHDAWPLDIDMDRAISVTGDVYNYMGRIGATPGDPNWWQRLDLDVDGVISTTGDVYMFLGRIGETCT